MTEITMTPCFPRQRRGQPAPTNPFEVIGFRVALDQQQWEDCAGDTGVLPSLFIGWCQNDLIAYAERTGRPLTDRQMSVLFAGAAGDTKTAWTAEEGVAFASLVREWDRTNFDDLQAKWLDTAAAHYADLS